MSEIVTIYRINCFASPEPGLEGESCSLLPWKEIPGRHGCDDGGRDYILPEHYAEGIAPGGEPAILSEEGVPCGLLLHNDRPLLIDETKRRAWLLEPVKKIATYRSLAGMTLPELAERLSVEPNRLYEWENHEREPEPETLAKIAEILGCDAAQLR